MILAKHNMSALPKKRTEVFQTLASLTMTIRREKGCARCELFQESEDPSSFELVEEWQSRTDLDEHLRSDVFGVLLGLAPLLARPVQTMIVDASAAEGAEAVKKARGVVAEDRG